VKLEHLEFKQKLDFLRNFANVNSNTEIGKNLHEVLDFSENYLNKLIKSSSVKLSGNTTDRI
jgi:hypothetical protein